MYRLAALRALAAAAVLFDADRRAGVKPDSAELERVDREIKRDHFRRV